MSSNDLHVVIGGASGFLGSALVDDLLGSGHRVTRLVRSASDDPDTRLWEPKAGTVDQDLINSADVVVNLSGAPIAQWPRTAQRRRELVSSRITATSTLANAIAKAPQPPALMSGSGMSWYGTDRGTEILDESARPGTGFMAELAQQWEEAAQPAVAAGSRVCFLRTSLVLDKSGGMLKLMYPAWKLGLGVTLGSGRQRMSLITAQDWVRAVTFLATSPISGPHNLAMDATITNAQFTKALGNAVHRPTLLKAPAFALRTVLGEVAQDLLGSLDIVPTALTNAGFEFKSEDLTAAIATALA